MFPKRNHFFLQLLLLPLLLLLSVFLLPRVGGSALDCNFNTRACCWKNRGEGAPWEIYRGESGDDENGTIIHSRFYRNQTSPYFLAASVTPQQRFSTDWTSCPLCSQSGLVTVRLRAHQTPSTRIKLCWKPVKDDATAYRHCTFLRTWRAVQLTSKHFTVTPNQLIQFYIKLYNHGGRSVATAIIDNITVITSTCDKPTPRPKIRSPRVYSVASVGNKHGQVTTSRPTTGTSTAAPNSSSSFILKDIFGDAFAQFLVDDSDGLTNDELSNDISTNGNGRLHALDGEVAAPIRSTPRPLFTFNILECNTSGGCLFDRSMCSYHNSYLSRGATFQRVSIYGRNFMQALTIPNTMAVMETDTMFPEELKIVFDVLEFTENERMYGCCYKRELDPQEMLFNIAATILAGSRTPDLFCPFATASHPTPVSWRTARFSCPRGTTKVLFMCENYGMLNGTCALDNIRLHKVLDVLEVEPCQKETVAFS